MSNMYVLNKKEIKKEKSSSFAEKIFKNLKEDFNEDPMTTLMLCMFAFILFSLLLTACLGIVFGFCFGIFKLISFLFLI